MKSTRMLSLVAVVVLATFSSHVEAVTPIQKVIEMLGEMAAKGKQEKHDEVVRFASFKRFCEGTIADKERSIEEANAQIEQLNADIAKADADVDQLGKEVAALDASIAGWEADRANATAVREGENADYAASHKDYSESVSALERAVSVLRSQNFDRAQATPAPTPEFMRRSAISPK